MKRLVYSPSVQAYVRTDDGIIDISEYIVSRSVSRVLNEVSTAEFTLRNPNKMFTKPGNPTFRPMDGITIFASRYKQHPVQIFTGYLDSTPYLQLFPGTCTIRASCTLKRLLHTYWDAGLPHTWNFLKKFGWFPDASSGTIFSQQAATQNSGIGNGGNIDQNDIKNAIITDGSVGNLLWNVLFEIGNWDEKQILIEKLPEGIIQTVADIMKTFEADDDATEQELKQFLKDMIGQYSPGSTAGDTSSGSVGGGGAVEVCASWYPSGGGVGAGASYGFNLQNHLNDGYAELSGAYHDWSAMGDLDWGHELIVTYGGKSVKMVKCDVGEGGPGCGGKPRAIDIVEGAAAKLPGFKEAGVAVVKIEGLKPGTVVRGRGGETITVPEPKNDPRSQTPTQHNPGPGHPGPQ